MVARKRTDYIVIHRSEMPDEAVNSYQFYVRRDGTVMVCLGEDEKSAAQIAFNSVSCAVAVEGCFTSGYKAKHNFVTRPQLDALVALLNRLQAKYPNAQLVGHSELGPKATHDPSKLVPATSCPGDLFPWTTLRALLAKPTV